MGDQVVALLSCVYADALALLAFTLSFSGSGFGTLITAICLPTVSGGVAMQ